MSNFGFFLRMNSPFVGERFTTWSVYGPSPGNGFPVVFLKTALLAGPTPDSPIANTYSTRVSGVIRLTVSVPVLSLAIMPVSGALGFLAAVYADEPTMSLKNDENGPPRYRLRLTMLTTSLALTGSPSE